MRPFEELTGIGKARRLRRLAEEVATIHYGLTEPRVRLLSMHSFNSMFRIDAGGARLVLRVGDACRIHQPGVEDIEAAWLGHLHETSTIEPPLPVSTPDGHWFVVHETVGVPTPRTCSLFTFLEGRDLRATQPDDASMRKAGALLAELHEHAADDPPRVTIPPGIHGDRTVYFHDENRVLTYESAHGTLFAEAIDRVQHHLDELWKRPPHAPHLLHGDFGSGNVMVRRGRLHPIDFQDLQYGFDLQDLALSLADLERRSPELVAPFIAGYRDVRPWPDLSPETAATLAAARSLNVMNLGLHVRKAGIAEFLDDHADRVAAWMQSGE